MGRLRFANVYWQDFASFSCFAAALCFATFCNVLQCALQFNSPKLCFKCPRLETHRERERKTLVNAKSKFQSQGGVCLHAGIVVCVNIG